MCLFIPLRTTERTQGENSRNVTSFGSFGTLLGTPGLTEPTLLIIASVSQPAFEFVIYFSVTPLGKWILQRLRIGYDAYINLAESIDELIVTC